MNISVVCKADRFLSITSYKIYSIMSTAFVRLCATTTGFKDQHYITTVTHYISFSHHHTATEEFWICCLTILNISSKHHQTTRSITEALNYFIHHPQFILAPYFMPPLSALQKNEVVLFQEYNVWLLMECNPYLSKAFYKMRCLNF